jgi:hypothetical protein
VGKETMYRAIRAGDEHLEIVCIDASPRMIQEDVE